MAFSGKTLTIAAVFVLVCLFLLYQQPETPRNSDGAARHDPVSGAPALAKDDCTGLASGCPDTSPGRTDKSNFDFYVLSLSWSPTWCRNNPDQRGSRQCSDDHGFVVHGLWPQNESGYPEFCATSEPRRVPESLGKTMLDLVPGMGLIGHQWRKHGSCSGLSQRDFFRLMRSAWSRVKIPAAFQPARSNQTISIQSAEAALVSANPGLSPNAVAITCTGSLLEEVRICLNKDLSFRSCPEVDRKSCRLPEVTVLPSR